MRWLFVALVVGHGLIHLMGFAKAFGFAELPQLTGPISKGWGLAWLAAALAMLVTGGLFAAASRGWWIAGLVAVALSQAVIVSSWHDARFGTIVNVLVLMGVLYGFASAGPTSFGARYRRAVDTRLAEPASSRPITEADLEPLPEPVRRYLRLAGAVGRPRVHHVRALWTGRIRSGPEDPWMAFTAEQDNFTDEPARFFHMRAVRGGLPVDVLHVFQGGMATMKVRLLSLVPLVDAAGPDLTRAETVTLLNDLCILAPGGLVDAPIRWEAVDDHAAVAHYAPDPDTVSARLEFNDAGELVDFVSDDRLETSPDGATLTPRRWSTLLRDYRAFGPLRAAGRGEGRWQTPEGSFAYIELALQELEVDGAR